MGLFGVLPGTGQSSFIYSNTAREIGWALCIVATFLSALHITSHLRKWSMPTIQAYSVRILLVVPVFAFCSSLALALGAHNGAYVEIVRDCYEAFVIYSFFQLILEYAGKAGLCVW
jgi:hypothetical protein